MRSSPMKGEQYRRLYSSTSVLGGCCSNMYWTLVQYGMGGGGYRALLKIRSKSIPSELAIFTFRNPSPPTLTSFRAPVASLRFSFAFILYPYILFQIADEDAAGPDASRLVTLVSENERTNLGTTDILTLLYSGELIV